MFTSRLREKETGKADMTLTIPESVFPAFMQYVYVGSFKVKTMRQVLDLFIVSDALDLEVGQLIFNSYKRYCSKTNVKVPFVSQFLELFKCQPLIHHCR